MSLKTKKILKTLGIIALVIVGIFIAWHVVLWVISLISYLFSLVVAGFEWLLGIIVIGFLAKVFFFGNGGSTTSRSSSKKSFFMPDAKDNIPNANNQFPHASDQVPDARDYDGHMFRSDRDRRRGK